MPMMDPKWLEFGIVGFVLVVVIVYILHYHLPQLVKSFREGLAHIATSMRDVNTTLISIKASVNSEFRKSNERFGERVEHCQETCRADREKCETRMQREVEACKQEVIALKKSIERLLQ